MSSRIPNLFHLLLFLAITFFSLLVCESVLAALHPHHVKEALSDQRLQLFVNSFTYALALAAAVFLFPLLWHRSFAQGISWNARKAHPVFIALGLALGVLSQAVSSLLPIPKTLPIEKIFTTPGIIWTLAAFGVFIAPLFEEIVFRGFLLPALAIAVDFLRLPKSPDPQQALWTLNTWRAADSFSRPALIASSLITSLLFGLLHAAQLGHSWPAVALLAAVSLVLCSLRLHTRSTAVSTLVHSSYNLSVFLAVFIQTGGFRHMDRL